MVKKVSSEGFLESNDIIKIIHDKIDYSIAKYSNNELENQFNEKYHEIIGFSISVCIYKQFK